MHSACRGWKGQPHRIGFWWCTLQFPLSRQIQTNYASQRGLTAVHIASISCSWPFPRTTSCHQCLWQIERSCCAALQQRTLCQGVIKCFLVTNTLSLACHRLPLAQAIRFFATTKVWQYKAMEGEQDSRQRAWTRTQNQILLNHRCPAKQGLSYKGDLNSQESQVELTWVGSSPYAKVSRHIHITLLEPIATSADPGGSIISGDILAIGVYYNYW